MPSSQISDVSSYSWSTVPHLLWGAYIEHLWNPQPGSWVGRTAATFRVLAFLVVLPVVILTLLDVTSYVIARTLGIVDDVKASTSDATGDVSMSASVPTILMQDSTPSEMSAPELTVKSDPIAAGEDAEGQRHSALSRDHIHTDAVSAEEVHNVHEEHERAGRWSEETRPQAFFAGEEDLQLAGVGVFSPAVSQSPSPEIPRIKLNMFEGEIFSVKKVMEEHPMDGISLRRRQQQRQEYQRERNIQRG